MPRWLLATLLLSSLVLAGRAGPADATHEPKGEEPGLTPVGGEFYNPDLVRFSIQNPSYNRSVIGAPGEQEPVIVRFEWLAAKGQQVLHTVDLDLTDALRTALNPSKTSTTGSSYRFDSPEHPAVQEMLRNPAIATPAARTLRITVDANETVAETDEGNNQFTLARPLPDLFFFGGSTFFRGRMTFTVLQAGPYFLGDRHALKLRFRWLDAEKHPMAGFREWDAEPRLGVKTREGLQRIAGEPPLLTFDSADARDNISVIRNYFLTGNIPPGSRFLRVEIDPDNVIAESRDDNNVRDFARPLPDLVIQSVTWREYPDVGLTYPLRSVSFRIRNRGTELAFPYRAGGNIGLRFSWRDRKNQQLGASITVDASPLILTPDFQRTGNAIFYASSSTTGFRTQLWLDKGVPAGATQLRIELDVLNLVEEQDENNTVTHVIRPTAKATGGRTKGAAAIRPSLLRQFVEAIRVLLGR